MGSPTQGKERVSQNHRTVTTLPLQKMRRTPRARYSSSRKMVLFGTGKSLDQFRSDDRECRQFAASQASSASSSQAATGSGAKRVIAGTAQHANAVHASYDYANLQCMYAKGHRIPVYLPPPPASQPPPSPR